jgi:signal transduction histidine kinase
MAPPLLSVLREVRGSLVATSNADPVETAVAKRLAREFDVAVARLEGKGADKDLISIVCHDLKDPLASIVMGVGYLKKTLQVDGDEGRAARRVVEAIARSAERMSQVISDFHDLSKLDTGTLELDVRPWDVVATLRPTMAPLVQRAAERSVALLFEAPNDSILARCDRARLPQIVAKLVANAIRFTPANGQVVVRVERGGERTAGGEQTGDGARITVRDTGRGNAPELLGEIFDHAANARRTPRDGPGLGLAIARGLVEAQGGTMSVESRVGEGSTFAFILPGA